MPAIGRSSMPWIRRGLPTRRSTRRSTSARRPSPGARTTGFRQAVGMLAETLRREDIERLYQEALRTPAPEDEAIVGRIRMLRDSQDRFDIEAKRIRAELAELTGAGPRFRRSPPASVSAATTPMDRCSATTWWVRCCAASSPASSPAPTTGADGAGAPLEPQRPGFVGRWRRLMGWRWILGRRLVGRILGWRRLLRGFLERRLVRRRLERRRVVRQWRLVERWEWEQRRLRDRRPLLIRASASPGRRSGRR